jgi:hypothetical protein
MELVGQQVVENWNTESSKEIGSSSKCKCICTQHFAESKLGIKDISNTSNMPFNMNSLSALREEMLMFLFHYVINIKFNGC